RTEGLNPSLWITLAKMNTISNFIDSKKSHGEQEKRPQKRVPRGIMRCHAFAKEAATKHLINVHAWIVPDEVLREARQPFDHEECSRKRQHEILQRLNKSFCNLRILSESRYYQRRTERIQTLQGPGDNNEPHIARGRDNIRSEEQGTYSS